MRDEAISSELTSTLKQYFVYIASNKDNNVLYTGVTNNLERRMSQHKNKTLGGFTAKYNVNKLVYYEEFSSPYEAIQAEKKIKAGSRKKKIDLIKSQNLEFNDLLED